MKIHLKLITNDEFYKKKSGFVDSKFVKICDELVIGQIKIWLNPPIPTLL